MVPAPWTTLAGATHVAARAPIAASSDVSVSAAAAVVVVAPAASVNTQWMAASSVWFIMPKIRTATPPCRGAAVTFSDMREEGAAAVGWATSAAHRSVSHGPSNSATASC
jgi:hypothetical protein